MFAVTMNWDDGTLSVHGPYVEKSSARLAMYKLAEDNTSEGLEFQHSIDNSRIYEPVTGGYAIELQVVEMGTPYDDNELLAWAADHRTP